MKLEFFSNWQITSCWVVGRLYGFAHEKGGILGVLRARLSALLVGPVRVIDKRGRYYLF